MSQYVSKSPRLPISKEDVERIERRLEALRAEAGTTRDPELLSRIEQSISALEVMLPVYESFVRLLAKADGRKS